MDNEMKWYMITTAGGKEQTVIESLRNRVISESLQDTISELKIALATYYTKTGKAKIKNIYPGYAFIKMNMTNKAWFIVRNTQYVTGLVGSSGNRTKPTPISEKEIKQIDKAIEKFAQDNSKGKKQEIQFQFKINDIIEIQTGPMKGLQGQVLEIKINSKKVVVNLELFNRMTPTEINMTDVKIIYSEKK